MDGIAHFLEGVQANGQGGSHTDRIGGMTQRWALVSILLAVGTFCSLAQTTDNPFPTPIAAEEDVIRVDFVEFVSIPDMEGEAARVMILVDEPGTGRLFVNDMRGPVYTVSYNGRPVVPYLDVDDPPPDFVPGGGDNTHDTVLLEWTASTPGAARYDGGPPREVLRFEQPFRNHNGGQIGFNPLAVSGDSDFGLLYIGSGGGGSGGDPLNSAQNLTSGFGKILRIDPLGSNSANGKYGIPADNPFVARGGSALGEIYAYGVRNPQRFDWDPVNGNMFFTDIGQGAVEEMGPVTTGANLGWNDWEGSFRFMSRSGVALENRRGDSEITYPLAEYDHVDPLLLQRAASTGLIVYREETIPQLSNRVLWGDLPSGEIFAVDADHLPRGGQAPIRRVLLNYGGQAKTLLQLIQEKNRQQGKDPATRADLRFGTGPGGQVFIMNKHDGTIRLLVPGR